MTNGWLIAAAADGELGAELAAGFELDLMRPGPPEEREAVLARLAAAANVGVLVSRAAARDDAFVALVRLLAGRRASAQLILAEPEARALFPFLPEAWPTLALDEALRRARLATSRRAGPLPPAIEPEPAPPQLRDDAPAQGEHEAADHTDPRSEQLEDAKRVAKAEELPPPEAAEPPRVAAPAPAPKRAAPDRAASASAIGGLARQAPSAPADATAFAPKKLRRGEAELVRIAIHQPKDLQAVIKAARKADPRTTPAPQSMGVGEVALGASVGVALEVKGAACEGALQRRTWLGEPLDFSFAVEAEPELRQVVILARVFVDDAQIGVLAFTRAITGPRPKPLSDGERVRLKRHKRVFLSYSSKDRETVSTIATAYQMAGVAHFWDRTSLKSGEEWHPRLRREIDRCDLFHLCWSKSAAGSEWVEKEATHALGLRRRSKKPDISVQMLDGPPWAKHPDSLDSINFDDFVRAAIVGYARGEE